MSKFFYPTDMRADEITRVEVIGDDGRLFTGYFEPGATLCIQDDGRTLKIFVGEKRDWREVIDNGS